MATITYTDNGEQKTVPMWATESQMEALLKHFGASGGKEKMEKVTETLVERIKDLNEAVNELSYSNDELVVSDLYKKTTLQTNFGAIFLALIKGTPIQLNLKQYLNLP